MELVSVQQAADELGVSKATIWRWLGAGHLRRYKNKPLAPRATFVDMVQARALKERPPMKRA